MLSRGIKRIGSFSLPAAAATTKASLLVSAPPFAGEAVRSSGGVVCYGPVAEARPCCKGGFISLLCNDRPRTSRSIFVDFCRVHLRRLRTTKASLLVSAPPFAGEAVRSSGGTPCDGWSAMDPLLRPGLCILPCWNVEVIPRFKVSSNPCRWMARFARSQAYVQKIDAIAFPYLRWKKP